MRVKNIWRISCAAMVAASCLSMSACAICTGPDCENQPSAGLIALQPENNVDQIKANDYRNQCDEQTRLMNHELASCGAVPLIAVSLGFAE